MLALGDLQTHRARFACGRLTCFANLQTNQGAIFCLCQRKDSLLSLTSGSTSTTPLAVAIQAAVVESGAESRLAAEVTRLSAELFIGKLSAGDPRKKERKKKLFSGETPPTSTKGN